MSLFFKHLSWSQICQEDSTSFLVRGPYKRDIYTANVIVVE